MKKGFFAGVLATLLVFSMVGSAGATNGKIKKELEYRDIKVSLDGEILDLRDAQGNVVEPFKFDGTNYVPVRAISEILGLNVAWDSSNATVILTTPQEQEATYITRTGSKYHNDPHCNGGTYWEVPYSTAVGMGLTPCEKCVHDTQSTVTETTADTLMTVKDGIRFYYTGIKSNADGGYDLKIRCENDSDYKIFVYTRDFTVNGKNIAYDMNKPAFTFNCTVDPGRSLDTVISIEKEALDANKITEIKRFSVRFAGYDTAKSGWNFETGAGKIDIG